MKVQGIFSGNNFKKIIGNINISENVVPVGEAVLAGSFPLLMDSMPERRICAGNRKERASDTLSLITAATTSVPLHKKLGELEDKFIRQGSANKAGFVKNVKYAAPVLNALLVAPLIIRKVVLPLNEKIAGFFRDYSEDTEGIIKIGDYFNTVFEK